MSEKESKGLEEILKNKYWHWQCCGGDYCEQSHEGEEKDLISAKSAIIQRIREVMPEKKDVASELSKVEKAIGISKENKILAICIVDGWNAYREEMLKRLEGI